MPHFFEFSDTFAKFGFCNTFIVNTFFIYLTLFHVKAIVGTYKYMIITFAVLGIIFSALELVARPFVHNYNKAFIYFSLNAWLKVPQQYLQLFLSMYAGLYVVNLSFITSQFIFRSFALKKPELIKGTGWLNFCWGMCYAAFCGVTYGVSLSLFLQPDDYSDEYLKEEMLRIYSLAIKEVPRLNVIPYANDGSLRWRNLSLLISGSTTIGGQYIIISILGIQMHAHIKKELRNISKAHRRLERQFFKALLVQIILPTILFILPAMPVLLLPLFDIEISVQSGGMYALFSIYPPLDSIAFMCIVSEYKKILRELYRMISENQGSREAVASVSGRGKIKTSTV